MLNEVKPFVSSAYLREPTQGWTMRVINLAFAQIYYQLALEYLFVPLLVIPQKGKDILINQAPDLLNYYCKVFIPLAKAHITKLEYRALHKWPKALFDQRRERTVFMVEKTKIRCMAVSSQ